MKKGTYILLLFACVTVHAQDLHFSQFYASPLTLSPAYTGYFNGDYRVGGNFKSQWPWAINTNIFTHRTFSAYADLNFLHNQLPGKDFMGFGLVVLNDLAGDGDLKVTKVLGSLAYSKSMGYNDNYFLSFGIGGGYVQKKIDFSQLYFNDQWNFNNLFFDDNIQTSEPTDDNLMFFDLSAGMNFSYFHNEDIHFSTGVALFHLNRPNESFSGQANRLGIRPAVNAMAFFQINRKVRLEPSFLYMSQKKAQEAIINALAGFTIQRRGSLENSVIYLGSGYRVKDALFPVVGFQYKTLKVLMNFDVNLSTLTEASNGNGGFEISLVYVGKIPRRSKGLVLPCPRM